MWWSSPRLQRSLLPALLGGGLALTLGGCFRPLYGPTPSGVPLKDVLAAIEVDKITTREGQERLGHYLRSELIFNLDGSGQPSPAKYRLTLDAAENVQAATVDTATGRADAAILNAAVKYSLADIATKAVIVSGTARGSATYYRDQQRFASIRAARDAEIRVANMIAEDIKQRLAAFMATRG